MEILQSKSERTTLTFCDGCNIEKMERVYNAHTNTTGPETHWVSISMTFNTVMATNIDICPPCWKRGLDGDRAYVVGIILRRFEHAAERVAEAKAKLATEPGLQVIGGLSKL